MKKLTNSIYRQPIINTLAISYMALDDVIFKWTGPLNGIRPRDLNSQLFIHGAAIAFRVGDGIITAPPAKEGSLDSYGEMVSCEPIAYNGQKFPRVWFYDEYDAKGELVHEKNAVLIRNNSLAIPQMFFIMPFLLRQDYAFGTMGIAQANVRSKRVYTVDDPMEKRALQDEIANLTDGVDAAAVIFKSGLLDGATRSDMKSLNSPSDLRELDSAYLSARGYVLDEMGIPNNKNQDKAERMFTSEIQSNNAFTTAKLASRLEPRRNACDEIMDLWPDLWPNRDLSVVSYFDYTKVAAADWFKAQGYPEMGGIAPAPEEPTAEPRKEEEDK